VRFVYEMLLLYAVQYNFILVVIRHRPWARSRSKCLPFAGHGRIRQAPIQSLFHTKSVVVSQQTVGEAEEAITQYLDLPSTAGVRPSSVEICRARFSGREWNRSITYRAESPLEVACP
jgi:hypothetical protein